MRIHVDGAELNSAASWVTKFTNWRVTNLAGVVVKADEQVTAAATNYENFATVTITADVERPGTVIIPGRGLAAVASQLGKGDAVCLSAEDGRIVIQRGRTRWTLPEIPADFAPLFPVEGDELGSVDGAVLATALKRVLSAVADERADESSSITVPSGVEFTLIDKLTLAATDRFRISSTEMEWSPRAELVLVLSERLCKSVLPILDGKVTMYSDTHTVTFASPHRRITGRLSAGKFLDWRNAIPPTEQRTVVTGGRQILTAATTVTVDTAEFLRSVTNAGVLSVVVGREAGDYLAISFSDEAIEIASHNKTHGGSKDGDVSDVIEPVEFSGYPIEVALQPHHLIEALKSLDTPLAMLTLMSDPVTPILIQGATEDGICEGFQHVLMPLNLAKRKAA